MDLAVRLGRGLTLQNPVIASSGTFGFGREWHPLVDIDGLGGIATKGVSWEAWEGNPPPRLWETAAGLLNSIGLQNPGVERFCREYLPQLRGFKAAIICNVVGESPAEYARVAARLQREAGVAALELNISCPNTRKGGHLFGTDPEAAAEVTRLVRQETDLPVIVKMVPNIADPRGMAQAVVEAGADLLSCINAVPALAIDVARRRPAMGGIGAGLSGPAIKPIALRVVWEVSHAVDVPIIGVGGVSSAADIVEFFMAGASAVMVGTATFTDPAAMNRMVAELPAALRQAGFESMQEAVRAAHGEA